MEYLAIVLALFVGYIIGILQKGITINYKDREVPDEYNKSVGLSDYTDYYDKTEGVNKF